MRDGRCLLATRLVQRDIELPLDPTVSVVAGTSVPKQDDASGQRGQAELAEPTARSAARIRSTSTNGMTGQSFQSRSSA